MSDPLQALPAIPPPCCFRYFTFFGINITSSLRCQPPNRQPPTSKLINLGVGSWESAASASRSTARSPVVFLATNPGSEAVARVQPDLDADRAVGGERLREAVVDVGAQRLQRELPVQVPLGARDLGAVQPARDADLDPARAEAERGLHGLPHRAAERHALLELHRDRFRDELRVQLGLLDLLDVDEDLAVGPLLDLLLQLVDLGPLAPDDDARARGVDVDLQLVGGALDLDLRDAGVREALLQAVAQLEVLVQQLRVVLVGEPPRAPGLVEPEPEAVRMNFLTHYILQLPVASFQFPVSSCQFPVASYAVARFARVWLFCFGFAPARRGRFCSSPAGADATIVWGRSATFTVRCAVRFTMRNARPIGAGRIRFCDGPWLAKHAAT